MDTQNRLYAYDVVRVAAMVFVIAVHSLVALDVSSTPMFILYAACQATFFTANALFFMLSGKFNLKARDDDESLKRYYIRRIRGFLIPILILFFVRTLYNLYPNFETVPHVLKQYAINTLGGFSGMEYWFVFTLFGFLVVAPFIAPAFSKMSPFSRKLFLGIGLLYNLLVLIAANRGVEFSWGYLFSGFALAFCAGAFIENLASTAKQRGWFYISAVAGLLITIALAYFGFSDGIHDISPFYTLLAIGIYLFILNAAKRAKPSKFISLLAKHSFSVYLVHMMFLLPLSDALPHLSGIASIGVYLALVFAVFVLSIAAAALIDAVLVKPAQRLFDKATKAISSMKA